MKHADNMRPKPLVSVVMIAYNMEKYIDEAIRGVLNQRSDSFDIELIIMDDCSTDSTPEIIARWHSRFPAEIRPVRNPRNLGLQGNYLAGFRLCRGDYMAICDADDYWLGHRKLERQVRYMESHPGCALSFHRMINYYEESGEMSLSNGGTPVESTLAQLSRSNYITNSSVLYRRSLVDLCALPAWMAEVTSPDYAMHMFYAAHGTVHFFRRPMGVYRKARGSAWSMTGAFDRLRMSMEVRRHLRRHFAGDGSAEAGLREASVHLLRSMAPLATDAYRRSYVCELAGELGVDAPVQAPADGAATAPGSPRRSILSALRATVSRLLPRPRPATSGFGSVAKKA